jgi:hypothetical protein
MKSWSVAGMTIFTAQILRLFASKSTKALAPLVAEVADANETVIRHYIRVVTRGFYPLRATPAG